MEDYRKKRILVLGATGSIGKSALDCIRKYPDEFELAAFSANRNEAAFDALRSEFPHIPACLASREGEAALLDMIAQTDADIAVNGISGAAGLFPSKAALESGKDLALANKETAVMAGSLIAGLAKKCGKRIVPVDSEHSAIFHLMEAFGRECVDEVVLTASGGPFRTWPKEKIAAATVQDALKHPTWRMGAKITVDSASLANKGLEVIEACALFNIGAEKIKVAVHPQSLVHSLVRTKDGDLYAQISYPDMRRPILAALRYPKKENNLLERFDFAAPCEMTFEPPRLDAFPLLSIAFRAAAMRGSYPIAFNASNEVAALLFLDGKIPFGALAEVTAAVMEDDWAFEPDSFEAVAAQDALARQKARSLIKQRFDAV